MTTPTVGTKGSFAVQTPYAIDTTATYTCSSVESFEALDALGVDIFTSYYSAKSISQEQYEEDRLNKETIVTLLSDSASTVVLPSSFILSYPTIGSVIYNQNYLVLDLGILPDNFNLDSVTSYCTEAVTGLTGVTATSEVVVHPIAGNVDAVLDATLTAARTANMDNRDSHFKAFEAERALNLLLIQKLGILEKILEDVV